MGKKGFNRRRGGGGGGGGRAAAQTEAEQYAELLELLRRHNESSEAERRRAKNRSRSVLALALALAQVILGMFLLAAEQLFPKKETYERRRGRTMPETTTEEARGRGADGGDASSSGAGAGGPDPNAETDEPSIKVASDPFEVLELDATTATKADVTRAYRKLVARWHPDKNGQSAESVAMTQAINAARAQCVKKLEGGVERDDGDENAAGTAERGDDDDATDSDDDVGGADHEEKARRRAERAYRKELERAEREYARRRKEERRRVREEARKPGGRYRRQKAAHEHARRESAKREAEERGGAGAEGEGDAANANANANATRVNRKKNKKNKKDKSGRYRADSDDDGDEAGGDGEGGALPPVAPKPHHPRMERCAHDVACAIRAGANLTLYELLQFAFPPLLEVDEDGNTPMHYAARFDPALVDVILTVVGDEWTRAVLIENNHGEKPVDALSPETEDVTAETAAAADRGKDKDDGTSPAAREARERFREEAAANAELSRRGAARLRQLTAHAMDKEEARKRAERRTFDAFGFGRLRCVIYKRFSPIARFQNLIAFTFN